MNKVEYSCDHKKCVSCNEPCNHTSDIAHAINFEKKDGVYFERSPQCEIKQLVDLKEINRLLSKIENARKKLKVIDNEDSEQIKILKYIIQTSINALNIATKPIIIVPDIANKIRK